MKSWKDTEIDELYARCGNSAKAVRALAEGLGIKESSWYLEALAIIKKLKARGEWKEAR